jgi:8-oxo-dGTP pyrophosphatase MutT (NUDIX family)
MALLKPEWFYTQSAVIPYVQDKNGCRIVMVTSRKGKRWIIPKGIVEPGMSPRGSARKEALEEAGIKGKISKQPIGTYSYHKWKGTCEVTVFAMEVKKILDVWEEEWLRTRELVSLEEAAERVEEKELKEMILSLPGVLKIEKLKNAN